MVFKNLFLAALGIAAGAKSAAAGAPQVVLPATNQTVTGVYTDGTTGKMKRSRFLFPALPIPPIFLCVIISSLLNRPLSD